MPYIRSVYRVNSENTFLQKTEIVSDDQKLIDLGKDIEENKVFFDRQRSQFPDYGVIKDSRVKTNLEYEGEDGELSPVDFERKVGGDFRIKFQNALVRMIYVKDLSSNFSKLITDFNETFDFLNNSNGKKLKNNKTQKDNKILNSESFQNDLNNLIKDSYLSSTELNIFNFLIENNDQIITFEDIVRNCFAKSDILKISESNKASIKTYISRIRANLRNIENNPFKIKNVRDHGYIFEIINNNKEE